MFHIRFSPSGADGNLFIYELASHRVYLLLHVDDIIVTSNHPAFTASIIHQLNSASDLKDLGLLHFFFGL